MFKKKQKINDSEVLKFGFLGGMAEAGYVFLVALVMTVLKQATSSPMSEIFGILMFLLLFVFSVAVSAILVFGYPLYLVTQKRFAESLMTVATTLVTIVIIGILVLILASFV